MPFDRTRWMINILARIKNDAEFLFEDDPRGLELINAALHHFCWKLHEKENKENGKTEHIRTS